MIHLELIFEENPKGHLAVSMKAPPQSTATFAEVAHAQAICRGIRQTLTQLQALHGSGVLVEKSTLQCPACAFEMEKQPEMGLYTCEVCGQGFGA